MRLSAHSGGARTNSFQASPAGCSGSGEPCEELARAGPQARPQLDEDTANVLNALLKGVSRISNTVRTYQIK